MKKARKAERIQPKKHGPWQSIKKYKALYLLMLPGFIWLFCFHIMPLFGIVIAFQDYNPMVGFAESDWVGLGHFKTLIGSRKFLSILKNTVSISAMKIFLGFPVPIILALLIHSCENRYVKKVVQTMSYLPNFLSWVVIIGISFTLFNPYYGVFRNIFDVFGWKYTDVTKSKDTFIGFLVASSIWKGMGMSSIVYLSALSGLDQEMFEAATVDGVNRWQKLWYITLPSIAPVCAIVLILSVGGLLSGDFEQIFLFAGNSSSLINISDVFETFVYRNGIRAAEFSFPAAVGLFQSFFACMLVLLTNKISKKLGYEGLW